MQAVAADTHAALWFMENDKRLSPTAAVALEGADRILLPSICLPEMIYLIEKRRLLPEVLPRLIAELIEPASTLQLVPLDLGVVLAMSDIARAAVPDLPDRIIAATALHYRVSLVTRDSKIRGCGLETIW
jgi:PIN domain nuclease of toxin-antitoxin system